MLSELSDGDVAHQVRSGSERALGELYDRYADRLFALASAVLDDPAEAEGAVADAFLRLWQERDHDPDRGSVGAYLVMITRSRALDRRRADRRRRTREERGAESSPEGLGIPLAEMAPLPDRAAEISEAGAQVHEALSQVSDKQRAVIGLAYFEGMTHSEIADHLSEPLGTVKTRLRDGMQKLRGLVAPPRRRA